MEAIKHLDLDDPDLRVQSDRALAAIIELTRAPGLDEYRKVYATLELPWPGDERICELYPVAVG